MSTTDNATVVITPTIGRRVWYWPSEHDRGLGGHKPATVIVVILPDQPCDAGICCVWSDRMVNLTVADHAGAMHSRPSVPLLQDGDPIPAEGGYATWMPYQTGQARKGRTPVLVEQGNPVQLTEDPDHEPADH